MKLIQKAKGFLFDLDGVFIQSGKTLPGAKETLKSLRDLNIPFRFLTNTTTKNRRTLQASLAGIGLQCSEEEIFTAGFSGVQTIRKLGSPACCFYITEKQCCQLYISSRRDNIEIRPEILLCDLSNSPIV